MGDNIVEPWLTPSDLSLNRHHSGTMQVRFSNADFTTVWEGRKKEKLLMNDREEMDNS